MAKTKEEKIAAIDLQMSQLAEQKKKLIQEKKDEEQKIKTKRLTKRMALLEEMLPEIVSLSDEQFQTFLERAVANDYGRRALKTVPALPPDSSSHSPSP